MFVYRPQICGYTKITLWPISLTPDPHPLPVLWKSKGPPFLAVCLSATRPFEWGANRLFPQTPAAALCSARPSRECLYLGCQTVQLGSGGLDFQGSAGDLGVLPAVFSPSTWITGEKEQEDRMGCCSGRCTLAFICGMQLVSVEIIIIIINPAWQWLKGQISHSVEVHQSRSHDGEWEKKILLCGVWVGRWMGGREKTNDSKV